MKKNRASVYIPFSVVKDVTFRDTDILRRFTSSQNKILPRRKTGLSAKAQRHVSRAVKQSREFGLMGYRGQ